MRDRADKNNKKSAIFPLFSPDFAPCIPAPTCCRASSEGRIPRHRRLFGRKGSVFAAEGSIFAQKQYLCRR